MKIDYRKSKSGFEPDSRIRNGQLYSNLIVRTASIHEESVKADFLTLQ